MAEGYVPLKGLTVESYPVEFTFNDSSVSAGIPANTINNGDNHIAEAKSIFSFCPGHYPLVTTDSQRFNVVAKITITMTGTLTIYVGCVY